MNRAYLEVGALFEEHWTGIPNVVAALTRGALDDPDIEWSFLYDNLELPRTAIEAFLRHRSGVGGLKLLADMSWEHRTVARNFARDAVGVFPNIKPMRRFFGKEAAIIHDLSPVTAPQFHNADNIIHFAFRIRQDIETSDHLFCVSRATLDDVHAYFGKPRDAMSVLPLGVDIDPADISLAKTDLESDTTVEPYIVIIGTLEPRKNGQIILDFLRRDPGFALRFRIVFIGRDGWLDEKLRLLRLVEEAGVSADRIIFTGFVSETEKVALILNSAFCVYPSFFEGYGLPVLEAGALGKLTVCSNSSSIPEVFPEQCIFFDPSETHELAEAMRVAELRIAQTRSTRRSVPDIVSQAAPYRWSRCYPEIARWVREQ